MANTAPIYVRIDPELKKEVEEILDELGVTPSALIQMLYHQIRLTKGIPFELKMPDIAKLSKEDFNEDIKDEDSMDSSSVSPLDKKESKTV